MLKTYFSLEEESGVSTTISLAKWWEGRRIKYNLSILAVLILVKETLRYFEIEPAFFLSSPSEGIWAALYYVLSLNLMYAVSWIGQSLYLHLFNVDKIAGLNRLFLGYFILSIICTLSPLLYSTIANHHSCKYLNEKDQNYVLIEPDFKSLVGSYQLDKQSGKLLGFTETQINASHITLEADSSFDFFNVPLPNVLLKSKNCELITARGTWQVNNYFGKFICLPLTFDLTEVGQQKTSSKVKISSFTMLRLAKDKNGYQLVVKPDPDYHYFIFFNRVANDSF